MAYSNGDLLKKAYRRLDTAGLTPDELEYLVEEADSLIDAKISRRYQVPVSPTPPLLRNISTRLAIYYFTFRQDQGGSEEVQRWIQTTYEQQLALLDQIADGTMSLVDSAGAAIGIQAAMLPHSDTKDATATFGIEDETLQVVDPDRLDDRDAAKG